MNTSTEHPHICRDSSILGGEPIIKGTRTPVRAIVENWRLGIAPGAIITHLPHLTLAQVFGALSYFADHQDEILKYIEKNRVAFGQQCAGRADSRCGIEIKAKHGPLEQEIPEYVEARIRREPAFDTPVLAGSTPIPCFGNAFNSKIATLGWNPSKREFVGTDGRELCADRRRLETLNSLRVDRLLKAPMAAVRAVFESCTTYFERRPYWWFKKLDAILRPLGASYYKDQAGKLELACHLDIVQNATDPG